MNNQPKRKILLAENNPDVRELLLILLEMHHYTVLEATDTAEAVRIALENLPDLIFLDLAMPATDGTNAIAEIRRQPELSKTPILVNSADGNRGIDFFLNIEKFGSGYIEYLAKPINYRTLTLLINSILDKQYNFQAAA